MKRGIGVVLLELAGCALNPAYESSLQSWVGSPVGDFVETHRKPDAIVDIGDYLVYFWDKSTYQTTRIPGAVYCSPGTSSDGRVPSPSNCSSSRGGGSVGSTSRCAWKLLAKDNVILETELVADVCDDDERPVAPPDQ
jgi:hypothetical protein